MIYCIGDIQGCYDALRALLAKIQFNSERDTLWFTGDLVNRGPQSLEVLRLVRSLGEKAITVLGNHDLYLLALWANAQPTFFKKLQEKHTLESILKANDCDVLCNWLRHQPLLYHAHGYTLVHAGLAPTWNLNQAQACAREVEQALQSENYALCLARLFGDVPNQWQENLQGWERLRVITHYFTRLRFCDDQGAMEFKTKQHAGQPPEGFYPWFKIPNRQNRDLKILFGHWAALLGQTNEPNVYALDTGCYWGHCLTAFRLDDQKRFSVAC